MPFEFAEANACQEAAGVHQKSRACSRIKVHAPTHIATMQHILASPAHRERQRWQATDSMAYCMAALEVCSTFAQSLVTTHISRAFV